jgi:hypothetical protein
MENIKNSGEIQTGNAPKNSNTLMYIILVILALGIIGLSIKLLSVSKEMKGLKAEKEQQKIELQKELDSLVRAHEQIKLEYGELSDSLTVKDSIIEANAREIKKLLNTRWEYYKVKKKLSRLQKIAQNYVRQMDSLYTVNHQLTEENMKIKEEIKIEKQKNQKLQQVKEELKEKVEIASTLHAYNVKATPVHLKGNNKERSTDKVGRVDRVNVCFTIGKNDIVEPGKKTVYVRIARPDKKILVIGRSDKYSFVFRGEKLQYSIKKDFDYNQESVDICVHWTRRETMEMQPGLYHVDLFEGDNEIGHITFTLK